MNVRLVIADDHPLVLQALQQLFEDHEDITVVASCTNGADALAAVRTHQPDVLLLDLKFAESSGLDVIRQMRAERLGCRTLLLTGAVSDEDMADALEMEVSGLVLKDCTPDDVVESVRHVARGHTWFARDTIGRALASRRQERRPDTPQARLTPRELELVKMAAEGLRNKEIASRLGITEGTVKIHFHNVYDKLGVDSRLELVMAAQHKHLI